MTPSPKRLTEHRTPPTLPTHCPHCHLLYCLWVSLFKQAASGRQLAIEAMTYWFIIRRLFQFMRLFLTWVRIEMEQDDVGHATAGFVPGEPPGACHSLTGDARTHQGLAPAIQPDGEPPIIPSYPAHFHPPRCSTRAVPDRRPPVSDDDTSFEPTDRSNRRSSPPQTCDERVWATPSAVAFSQPDWVKPVVNTGPMGGQATWRGPALPNINKRATPANRPDWCCEPLDVKTGAEPPSFRTTACCTPSSPTCRAFSADSFSEQQFLPVVVGMNA